MQVFLLLLISLPAFASRPAECQHACNPIFRMNGIELSNASSKAEAQSMANMRFKAQLPKRSIWSRLIKLKR